MDKINLLLVEDDEHFYNLLQALFTGINKKSRTQYTLKWVSGLGDVTPETLEGFDAVLLDYNLGEGMTGMDLLRDATEKGCRTPIIFLTGQGGREIFHEAGESGASGYLIKQEITKAPFSLEAVVHFAVENGRQRERLRLMATLDGLTALLNHGEMQRRLDAEIARANRNKHPLSLILMDIDHFKRINDTHGHPAGDSVLKWLAEKLRENCRKSDILARYGGEEFLVILPETDLSGTIQKAETLRRDIASWPFREGELSIPVTASFGVAQLRPGDNKQVLMERADEALYGAKRGGRNKVVHNKAETAPQKKADMKTAVKLLVVDDDRHMLNLFAGKLSGIGYEIALAASGDEALEIMGGRAFDAVILDQAMPDMDGVETLKRMTRELLSVPPVIMISAADSRHLAVEFMKLPAAADFSAKPINFDLLDVQIKSALRTRRLRQARDRERVARAAAEEISRLKDTFLAQMSREFMNPLNVIRGFVGIAEKAFENNGDPEPLEDALAQIKTGALELGLLVEELFHATKTEFGAGNLELIPVEIPGTLRNVSARIADRVREKGLILNTDFDAGLPLILADPKRVILILKHLLDNAVKFTPKGEITLGASADGSSLQIDIADTGIGIAPENQERIFNRFTRVDTSGHLPGAGMGLYLARFWAEKMNGRLWVESEPDRGTTVHLAFPLWEDEGFD